MLLIQERILRWVREFEERTAGGAPTAELVAEGLGLDTDTALCFMVDLYRLGYLQSPRFALLKKRRAPGS